MDQKFSFKDDPIFARWCDQPLGKSTIVLLAIFILAGAAFAAEAAGTWQWSQPGADGRRVTVTLTLEVGPGNVLAGTYAEAGDFDHAIRDGRISNESITFSVEDTGLGAVRYTGQIDGNTINGVIEVADHPDRDGRTLDWTARRTN